MVIIRDVMNIRLILKYIVATINIVLAVLYRNLMRITHIEIIIMAAVMLDLTVDALLLECDQRYR